MSPITLSRPRLPRLGGRLAASPAGTGAALAIHPYSVPVDFGWNQRLDAPREWGQDFEVTFTNGSSTLLPGTSVLLRANFWMVDPSPPAPTAPRVPGSIADVWQNGGLGLQAAWPGEANHVELGANRTGARLEVGTPLPVNVQFRVVPVTVRSGRVAPGESFTVRFRNCCSLCARHPSGLTTSANDRAFAAVIGRPSDDGGSMEYELVDSVRGGWMEPLPAAGVYAAAPSRVRPGEEFTLRLAVLDTLDNLCPEWTGALTVACSDPRARVNPIVALRPRDGGRTWLRVTLGTEGVHRFTFRARDFAGSFETAPIEVSSAAMEHKVLWGDYHGHSWRCDGTGDPGQILRYAQDVAFLDWYALTPHDAPGWPLAGAMRWDHIARQVEGAHQEGSFVTLPAFEWTRQAAGGDGAHATSGDGHHVVLARDWGTLLQPFLPSWSDPRTSTAWKLHREMIRRHDRAAGAGGDFMIVPHDLMSGPWWEINAGCPDGAPPVTAGEQARFAPLAQVYSHLHGNHESAQEDGTAGGAGWRAHTALHGEPAELAGFVSGLKYGGVYGVVAGGDSHSARPGSFSYGALTAVLAKENTRDGVFDALRARHTYATSGHRLLIEFSHPRADGGAAIMGDVVPFAAGEALAPELAWRVASPQPVRRVRVVRVRAPAAGEDPYQEMGSPTLADDAWKFVEYVVDEVYDEGDRPREVGGTFRDEGFRADAWEYASYFLVVHHENGRPHGRDGGAGLDTGDWCEDRGWTSPIFFRRGDG